MLQLSLYIVQLSVFDQPGPGLMVGKADIISQASGLQGSTLFYFRPVSTAEFPSATIFAFFLLPKISSAVSMTRTS